MSKKAINLSTYLQKSSLDLITASHLIAIFENVMKSLRTEYESEFKQIEIEATELAQNVIFLWSTNSIDNVN